MGVLSDISRSSSRRMPARRTRSATPTSRDSRRDAVSAGFAALCGAILGFTLVAAIAVAATTFDLPVVGDAPPDVSVYATAALAAAAGVVAVQTLSLSRRESRLAERRRQAQILVEATELAKSSDEALMIAGVNLLAALAQGSQPHAQTVADVLTSLLRPEHTHTQTGPDNGRPDEPDQWTARRRSEVVVRAIRDVASLSSGPRHARTIAWDFSGIRVLGDLELGGSVFAAGTRVESLEVAGELHLGGSEFLGYASIRNVSVGGNVWMGHVSFHQGAAIESLEALPSGGEETSQVLSIDHIASHGPLHLRQIRGFALATVNDGEVIGDVDIEDSRVGAIDIINARVHGSVRVIDSSFDDYLCLRESDIRKHLTLARLGEFAELEYPRSVGGTTTVVEVLPRTTLGAATAP